MLIMPSTDINFQSHADNIVRDFFVDGVSLSDSIVKVAKDNSFTPEEVKRLVEKTNTQASLHLLKTSSNKKAVFRLANTDLILRQTHPVDVENDAGHPCVYSGLPGKETPSLTKNEDAEEKTASYNGLSVSDFFRLQRYLELRKQEKVATELKIQDDIDYLASEFNVWHGPDFCKFASEATAVYGELARPVLEGISKYLCIELPSTKIASDIIIDDTTPQMRALGDICTGLKNLVKSAEEISIMQKTLDTIWADIKHDSKK